MRSCRVSRRPMRFAARPGHHAFADVAGGFCFLNNSAIAAQRLRKSAARVAILDVDLHHGNGTQGIFYAAPTCSPCRSTPIRERFYPFFWGYADERGEGRGLGHNLNLPLPQQIRRRRLSRGAGRGPAAHPFVCAGSAGRGAGARCVRRRSVRRAFRHDAGLRPNRGGDHRARPAHGRSSRKAATSATRSRTT